MTARFARREAGYPLPRRTELARIFQAAPAAIDAAIDELIDRGLLLRLPSGQVHRAGPAECSITFDGLTGLSSFIDPLDRRMTCTDIHFSRHRAPLDITKTLGLPPATELPCRRCLWRTEGRPVATSVTYVHERYARHIGTPPAGGNGPGEQGPQPPVLALDGLLTVARPAAVRIEIQPPGPAIARRLRLASGQAAILVTARLDTTGPAPCTPAALTTLALRPELVRLVLEIHPDTALAPPASPAPAT